MIEELMIKMACIGIRVNQKNNYKSQYKPVYNRCVSKTEMKVIKDRGGNCRVKK